MSGAIQLSGETVERLQATLRPDPAHWRQLLRGSTARTDGTIELSETALLELSDFAELDPRAVLEGTVDFKALARHRAGDLGHIPEEFQAAARSRVRTSAHLLDFVEIGKGWRFRHKLLRRFQVTEAALSDPDRSISIRFLSRLCESLLSSGLTHEDLYQMGQYSVLTNSASEVGKKLKKLEGPKEVFEKVFTDLIGKYWDRNFDYRLLSLDSDQCVVEAAPSAEVADLLQQRLIGNSGTCASRGGTFSSLTGYLNLPLARVTETHCIHRGDPRCRYHIDFSATFQ